MKLTTTTHTEDCMALDDGGECAATYGQWDQPPGTWVGEAEGLLGREAPWCQIRALAWELSEKNDT